MAGVLEILCDERRVAVQVAFDRFRTLRLSVRRDGSVTMRAPRGTSLETVRQRLQLKAQWICRHLERFAASPPPAQALQYVSGERHLFLGQSLLLHVVQGTRSQVRLEEDRLEVTTRLAPQPRAVRRLVDAWHLEQSRELFTRIIRSLLPRCDALGIPRPSKLTVRAMTSRWGSCSRSGNITLNRQLIRTPQACIEFVAAHELCHLRHHGHHKAFYELLSALLPDWKERKARLAQF